MDLFTINLVLVNEIDNNRKTKPSVGREIASIVGAKTKTL